MSKGNVNKLINWYGFKNLKLIVDWYINGYESLSNVTVHQLTHTHTEANTKIGFQMWPWCVF